MSQSKTSSDGMETVLDWDAEADATNIRPGSIELQRVVHRKWFEKIRKNPPAYWLKNKPLWRVNCLEKLELLLDGAIHGSILEVGAGTALCSAYASMRPGVSHVTALDYDRFCVDEVMPTVFEKFGAQREKIERAYGSYNHIPRKGFYDFIIAVGALHHSEDLNVSFKSLYDALKPGGILLVSDVCEPDSLTNAALTARYETVDPGSAERYGRLVKVQDNGDHWYRLSQWLSSAWASGFESLPFLFDHVAGMSVDDEIFRRPKPYLGFSPVSYQPYFAVNGQYDRLVLVLEKPDVDGSAPVTGKAAAWTVDEYAGAWASRHSLAAVTQRGRFSSLLAGLLGQN